MASFFSRLFGRKPPKDEQALTTEIAALEQKIDAARGDINQQADIVRWSLKKGELEVELVALREKQNP